MGEDARAEAAGSGAPDESGNGTQGQVEAKDDAKATPSEEKIRVNYRGKMVELPMDKAVALVSKGYDYEQKMAALKQERQQMVQDAQGLQDFMEYRTFLQQNPKAAERVHEVLRRYEEEGVLPALDYDSGEQASKAGPESDHIRRLEARLQQLESEKQSEQVSKQLVSAIESNPTLLAASNRSIKKTGQDYVLEKLVEGLRSDPQASIQAVADRVATELEALTPETLRDEAEAYLQKKQEDAKTFVSEPSGGAAPDAAPQQQKRYTLEDWKSGRMQREAKRFLAGMPEKE